MAWDGEDLTGRRVLPQLLVANALVVNASVDETTASPSYTYGVTGQARGRPSLPTKAKAPTAAASSALTASAFAQHMLCIIHDR